MVTNSLYTGKDPKVTLGEITTYMVCHVFIIRVIVVSNNYQQGQVVNVVESFDLPRYLLLSHLDDCFAKLVHRSSHYISYGLPMGNPVIRRVGVDVSVDIAHNPNREQLQSF